MDDKNPRVGGERMSGRTEETTRGKLDTAEPAVTGHTSGTRTRSTQPPRTSTASKPGRSNASTEASEAVEPRTHEIRAEIEHTRDDLSETVNAIQDRLRPSNVAATAKETVKNAARDRARDVAESEPVQYVRSNPIPTAMIGVGLAGLAMLAFADREDDRYGRRRYRAPRDWRTGARVDRPAQGGARAYSTYESADVYTPGLSSGRYDSEDEQYFGGAGQALDYDGDERGWSGRGRQRDWPERGRRMVEQRQNQLRRTWDESPLLIGAASAVIGAIVGLAIPETERENQMLGEARDSMVESVQGTVREKVNEVQQAATNAANTVKDTAAAVTGLTTETGSDEQTK